MNLCGVGVTEQWNKFKTQSSSKYFRKGPLPLIHVTVYSETVLPSLLPKLGGCPLRVSANKQLSLLGSENTAAPSCRQLWLGQTGLSSASGTPGSRPDPGVSWGVRAGWGETAWGWKTMGRREMGCGACKTSHLGKNTLKNRRFLESNNADSGERVRGQPKSAAELWFRYRRGAESENRLASPAVCRPASATGPAVSSLFFLESIRFT